MKIINNLHFLLYDDNVFVQKKLILSLISIYKSTLLVRRKTKYINKIIFFYLVVIKIFINR